MTFALPARCPRTGMIGAAVTTSSLAVGSRCAFARAKVGAVLTQHRTDPRLGPRGLDLLASGCSADDTVRALVASSPDIGWRQLAVIDGQGRTAAYAGDRIKSVRAEVPGRDCVAIGNIIANPDVPAAMVCAFERDPSAHLAERLTAALEAGLAAGGEN